MLMLKLNSVSRVTVCVFLIAAVGMNPLVGGGATTGAALPGALPFGPPIPHSAYSFAASQQLMAAARDQELFYRDLLSRPPYSTDPVLAQQVHTRVHVSLFASISPESQYLRLTAEFTAVRGTPSRFIEQFLILHN